MFRYVAVLVLCLSGVLYAASFQGLGFLPGGSINFSAAEAISADGSTVVGSSASSDGGAFRWTQQGGMVSLGDLPGTQFGHISMAVSGDGSVVVGRGQMGEYSTTAESVAFKWTSETGTVALGSSAIFNDRTLTYQTIATDISNDGAVVVGRANYHYDPLDEGQMMGGNRPCYWNTDGQMNLLIPPGYTNYYGAEVKAISEDGRIILISQGNGLSHTWSEDTGFVELSTEMPNAWNMSGDGSVFGGLKRDGYSYIWSEENGLTVIGLPDGWDQNGIFCINGDGSVVAGYLLAEEYYDDGYDPQYLTAYIWDELNGTRLVEDVLTEAGINLDGWMLTGVSDISADGMTICGSGINPDGDTEAWVATIPEPATVLMLAAGALGLVRRRREN